MAQTDKPVRSVAGLAAIGLVVCCGLPVLLSLGAGITIAGLGLRSWALAAAGIAAVALGVVRSGRHRSCDPLPAADRTDGADHSDPRRTR